MSLVLTMVSAKVRNCKSFSESAQFEWTMQLDNNLHVLQTCCAPTANRSRAGDIRRQRLRERKGFVFPIGLIKRNRAPAGKFVPVPFVFALRCRNAKCHGAAGTAPKIFCNKRL